VVARHLPEILDAVRPLAPGEVQSTSAVRGSWGAGVHDGGMRTLTPWRNLGACLGLSALLAACGGSSTSTPSPSPTPTPLACTSGGAASATWMPPSSRTATTPPIVSAAVSGDTLTLTFDQGTPAFEVTPQSSSHFTETGGRGGPVDLTGSAGVLIVLRGFRGDMQNYTGPPDLKPNGHVLLEVREIGDFEGVIGWAAGLSAPGCANVTSGSATLTFQFVAHSA
jgi:hypothetical protein